jgi:hypothetical protein
VRLKLVALAVASALAGNYEPLRLLIAEATLRVAEE